MSGQPHKWSGLRSKRGFTTISPSAAGRFPPRPNYVSNRTWKDHDMPIPTTARDAANDEAHLDQVLDRLLWIAVAFGVLAIFAAGTALL
jgi:hypothetical protein